MKNGFTLVELSIVLVIIGLLIGGILVGQSLIQSAQINALVRQTTQFDIATIQFKVKYKSIPGDSRILPNPGNGNAIMEDSYMLGGGLYSEYFDSELANFWYHLSITGFQPERVIYSNSAVSGIKAGVNIPKAAFGKGDYGPASFLPYSNYGNDGNSYYFISDWNHTTNTEFNVSFNVWSYPFTPVEAMAIDSKLDDGHLSVTPGYTGIVHTYNPDAGTKCFSGTDYLVSHKDRECVLFIKIASDTGDMKVVH